MLRSAVFVLLLGYQCAALGQGVCTVADSFVTCERRTAEHLNQQVAGEAEATETAKNEQKSAAHELLSKVNTGAAEALSALPTSAFTDFFSLLKIAAATDQGGEDDSEAWAFALNRCSPARREPTGIRCQLRGRVGGASLYEPLIQALPEATRTVRTAELEDALGAFDDVTVGFFLNLENERFGRRLRFAEDPLYDALFNRAREASKKRLDDARRYKDETYDFAEVKLEESNRAVHAHNLSLLGQRAAPPEQASQLNAVFSPPLSGEEIAAYNRLVAQFDAAPAGQGKLRPVFDPIESDDVPFADYPDALGTDILARWEQSVRTDVEAGRSVLDALRASGYFDLYRLANNQPQLSFGVELRSSAEQVGPDEIKAKVSWEFGFTNLNDLKHFAGRSGECSLKSAEADTRSDCLAEYLGREDVRADLDSGDRFALTVEYSRRKDYSVQLPDDSVSLELEGTNAVVGSVVWGRYLSLAGTQAADFGKSRVDLVASYEDVSSDPARQDRGIANLTFSQELSGGLVLSLSAVYATEPEFRGEVDEEWSSRLGLNYKLARPER